MNLIPKTDSILRASCLKFDFSNPPMDPVELVKTLHKTMIDNSGVGLAAPQVGLLYHCFVLNSNPVLSFFNAKIVSHSKETVELEEGCLTFPGVVLKITRPRDIRVRYSQANGETLTKPFTGMTARIIQHEIDHCNGILFSCHVSKLKWEMACKKAKK